MPEPTIDEMLQWIVEQKGWSDNRALAIRAILEQHRPSNMTVAEQWWELREHKLAEYKERAGIEAIRAFVERVEKRMLAEEKLTWRTIRDELAAMEEHAQTNS